MEPIKSIETESWDCIFFHCKKGKTYHSSTFYDFILHSKSNWVQKPLPMVFFELFIEELEKWEEGWISGL